MNADEKEERTRTNVKKIIIMKRASEKKLRILTTFNPKGLVMMTQN